MKKRIILSVFVFLMSIALISCTPAINNPTAGNTSGNINNGARFVTLDEWVYFSVAAQEGNQGSVPGFYRCDLQGKNITQLDERDLGALFISGETIVTSLGFIYDPQTSSVSTAAWADSVTAGSAFVVAGTMIYLSNADDGNKLYSIKLDGTHLKKLTEVAITKADVVQGWIYYSTQEPETIRKIKTNGEKDTLVTELGNSDFIIHQDLIFYVNKTSRGLSSISLNGDQNKNYGEYGTWYGNHLNEINGVISWIDGSTGSIAKLIIADNSFYRLSSTGATAFYTAGDFVYLFDSIYPDRIIRINNNGVPSDPVFMDTTQRTVPSSGNINNGSEMIEVNGWIYLSETVRDNTISPMWNVFVGGLSRFNPVTNQRELISFDNVGQIMRVGNRIFTSNGFRYDPTSQLYTPSFRRNPSRDPQSFVIIDDIAYYTEDNYFLASTKVNGAADNLQTFGVSYLGKLNTSEGDLYYSVTDPDQGGIFKIAKGSSVSNLILRGTIEDYLIEDGILYYVKTKSHYDVYNTLIIDSYELLAYDIKKGTETNLLTSTDQIKKLNKHASSIYFIGKNDLVYQISTQGKDLKKISSSTASSLYIFNDQLYVLPGNPQDITRKIDLTTLTETKFYPVALTPSETDRPSADTSGSFSLALDGYVYTSAYDRDYPNTIGTYRSKPDGSEKTKITNLTATMMAYVEGWIYFIDATQNSWIFRMKPDGSQVSLALSEPVKKMIIKGDWIYYCNDKLGRVHTDGTQPQILQNTENQYLAHYGFEIFVYVEDFTISGNTIVFNKASFESANGLFRMDLDGRNKKLILMESRGWLLNVVNDVMYYAKVDESHGNIPYRIGLDGKNMKAVTENEILYPLITINDVRYYLSQDRLSLMAVNTDGSNHRIIASFIDPIKDVSFMDSKIIVSTTQYGQALATSSVNYDGTGLKLIASSLYH